MPADPNKVVALGVLRAALDRREESLGVVMQRERESVVAANVADDRA